MVSIATEKRGMLFRDSSALFMMIPPSSIPTATAGRFTAPAATRIVITFRLKCPEAFTKNCECLYFLSAWKLLWKVATINND